MSIDAIQAIGHSLTMCSPMDKADPVAVHPSAQQQFAALLGPSAIQKDLAELAIGTELITKFVGSGTQTINKLANLS